MHYQLQAQQNSQESQLYGPADALFSLWRSVYHFANKVASPQAAWLALSGALLLGYGRVGISEKWMQSSAFVHCLVQSCASCCKAVPLLNKCNAAPAADSPQAAIQQWLQQHPQHLAALQAALVSPGLQHFLWKATAILTSGLHTYYDGTSVVYSEAVPADHLSLSAGVEFGGRPSEDSIMILEFMSDLLSCLSYLHVDLPAEGVLKVIVEGEQGEKQQQQERQHAAAGEGTGTAGAGTAAHISATPGSQLVGASSSQSFSTSALVCPFAYGLSPYGNSFPVPPSTPTPLPASAACWSPSCSSSLDVALRHSGLAAAAHPSAASSSPSSFGTPFNPVYAAAPSACESRFWDASRAQMSEASSGAATAASAQIQQRSLGDTAAAAVMASLAAQQPGQSSQHILMPPYNDVDIATAADAGAPSSLGSADAGAAASTHVEVTSVAAGWSYLPGNSNAVSEEAAAPQLHHPLQAGRAALPAARNQTVQSHQQVNMIMDARSAAVPGGTVAALAQTAVAAGLAPGHALMISKLVVEMYADYTAQIQLQQSVPSSPACPAPISASTPSPFSSPAAPSSSSRCSPSSAAPPRLTQPPVAGDAAVGSGAPCPSLEEQGNTSEALEASCTVFWLMLKACGTLSSISSDSSAAAASGGVAAARGANHEAESPSAPETMSAPSSAAAAPAPPPAAAAFASLSAPQLLVSSTTHLAGPSTTLEQLQLVLELLLLTWPDASQQESVNGMHGWGWLLLLVGLLQQAPGVVREQLMQQRGSQLMQLLYHVLQEEEELGGKGVCIWPEQGGVSFVGSLTMVTKALAGGCELQQPQEGRQSAVPVHFLVLLLLQSLFLQAPSWQDLLSASRLERSSMMLRCSGKL